MINLNESKSLTAFNKNIIIVGFPTNGSVDRNVLNSSHAPINRFIIQKNISFIKKQVILH